ncbi:28178_t:CDS:1, partial [Gigaspora margarita]
DAKANINVTTKKKSIPKANIASEANDVTFEANNVSSETNDIFPEVLSDGGFVLASLYQAESQVLLANTFNDLDVSSYNNSSA